MRLCVRCVLFVFDVGVLSVQFVLTLSGVCATSERATRTHGAARVARHEAEDNTDDDDDAAAANNNFV